MTWSGGRTSRVIPMHLYKRKDSKFWWYKFEMDGVAYQGSTKTRNRRDAEGIASAARLKAIHGKYDIKRQKATPLFKDAMVQFLAYVKEQNAGRTYKRYECSSRPLIKAFGKKPLNQITPDDVEKFKNNRLTGGKRRLKPATVNNDLACVKALYAYFITLQTVTENPAKPVKFLPMNNEQTRVFSFEEERLYLAACEQPLHDVAILMLDTEMRPDEIYRMKRENVNLALGTVFNPYGKSKAARRKLALTARAAELLRIRLGAGESVCVFPDENDPSKPIGDLNYLHRKALKDSGIAKARMYDLRHTFASRAVEAGVDLVTLAALMGHSKIQMVLRYAHPFEEHQLLAIRKLEEFTIAKQIAETNAAAAGFIN